MDVTPHHDDFELEEVSDDEEGDTEDFDLELEELTDNEEDLV